MSTTTALAMPEPPHQPALHAGEITRERVELWKRTYCKGASDDELALFVGTCQRTGLAPEARQLFAVKRWDGRERREVMSIQVSIDGFRLVADRACAARGWLRSEEPTMYFDTDGKEYRRWLSDKAPIAAEYTAVIVAPNGQTARFTAVARFAEYAQKNKEGRLTGMWATMPALMVAKCAEALCLRKAFPQELSGLYTTDEMAQAEAPVPPARIEVSTAPAGNIDQDGELVIRTGDAKKRILDLYINAGFEHAAAKTYAADVWKKHNMPTAGFVSEADFEPVWKAAQMDTGGLIDGTDELDDAFGLGEVA